MSKESMQALINDLVDADKATTDYFIKAGRKVFTVEAMEKIVSEK